MLLPVTLCLAHGIVMVGQAAGRVPVGGGVVPRIVVAGALLLAVSLPNVVSMGRSLWYVYNPHEELARDLFAWAAQGDVIYTSWRERQRVLRHTYEPAEHGTRFSFLTSQAPFPFSPASAHSQWFVATGKVEVHPPFAAEMLSEKFARVPYHEFFLAHAPNPQRVVFGETFRGLPEVTGPLVIPPGSHVELPVVMPRAGRRAVYAEFAPASLARGLTVGLGEEGANTVQQVSPRENYLRLGELVFQRGKALLTLENPSDQLPVTVSAIEAVPTLDTTPVTIPAWDFYSMDGGESVATVWPEHVEGRVLLRDMRLGHTAYYRFESRRGGPTVIRLFALNDPPGANDYQVFLVGAGLEAIRLSFDAEDGEVGYRDTPVLNLPAGVHTLAVTYLGVDPEVLRARTENFRIMTRERLQHPGLDRIELYNVGGN
jgi:hypothetical protein